MASPHYPGVGDGDVGVFSIRGELLLAVRSPRIEPYSEGGNYFGYTFTPHIEMGSVGDIDGDEIPDFYVDTSVYSGKSGEVLVRVGAELPPEDRQVIHVSDVNRDGHADFLVLTRGNAYVVSPQNRVLHTITVSKKSFVMRGAGGGDLDGDGHADYLFGHQTENERARSGLGRVSAFSGKTCKRMYLLKAPDIVSFGGAFLGDALVFLGDLDGDGNDDFAASDDSVVRAYSGDDGSTIWSFEGNTIQETQFSFSPIADIDGDGTTDLIVGEFRTPLAGGELVSQDVSVVSGRSGEKIHAITRLGLEPEEDK